MTSTKPKDSDSMQGQDESNQLDNAVYEAGLKAQAESGMVVSQAQRLFYEVWNKGGDTMSIMEGKEQFDRCMRMAEEIREICAKDFRKRLKSADEEFRKKHGGGKGSRIILPSARDWANWRPEGQ